MSDSSSSSGRITGLPLNSAALKRSANRSLSRQNSFSTVSVFILFFATIVITSLRSCLSTMVFWLLSLQPPRCPVSFSSVSEMQICMFSPFLTHLPRHQGRFGSLLPIFLIPLPGFCESDTIRMGVLFCTLYGHLGLVVFMFYVWGQYSTFWARRPVNVLWLFKCRGCRVLCGSPFYSALL